MIDRDELIPIGQFKKPHGRMGEIVLVLEGITRRSLSNAVAESPFIICEMDGIFVPFRVECLQMISDSMAYIQLKNIKSDREARVLFHKEVYFPKKNIVEEEEEDVFSWNNFVGFSLIDEKLGKIGRIVDVDETTMNTLFIVEKDDEEILIPAVDEFIILLDDIREEVIVALPEGLLE